MIKKIMNPVSAVLMFLLIWLCSLPLAIIGGIVVVGLLNTIVFQQPIGMWFVWYVGALTIMSSFAMTIEACLEL